MKFRIKLRKIYFLTLLFILCLTDTASYECKNSFTVDYDQIYSFVLINFQFILIYIIKIEIKSTKLKNETKF